MKLFRFDKIRENLSIARFDRQELSGSLGDLGTFLPIILGLSAVAGLSFPAMLFWAGASNIATGLIFAIPMPVQPMKAIAAVALSEGMNSGEVYASGLIMALFMLLIWSTNFTKQLDKIMPKIVVRGIQFSVGLKLFIKGAQMIYVKEFMALDGIIIGLVGIGFALFFYKSNRVPTALILFVTGIIITFIADQSLLHSLSFHPYLPNFVSIGFDSFRGGLLKGAVSQLPLTLLNSVIAVSALSYNLFPKHGAETRKISLSVGLINLTCLFGAMPMCHGSGGLAAQSRFGARTNGSILLLGTGKLLAAIVLGSSLLPIVSAFPESLLGVLLLIAGTELIRTVRDVRRLFDIAIVLAMATASIISSSLTIGFVFGVFLYLIGRAKFFRK